MQKEFQSKLFHLDRKLILAGETDSFSPLLNSSMNNLLESELLINGSIFLCAL